MRVLLLLALTLACRASVPGSRPQRTDPPPPVAPPSLVPPGSRFMIAAAGDVAGKDYAQDWTAGLLRDLLRRNDLKAILLLGDVQYPRGDYEDFLRYYGPSWGVPELRAITRPVPGNHEYDQGRSEADGYFDYFNGVGAATGIAGGRGQGYYSFDMGDWHFVALNTSDGCRKISCRAGSPQHTWLVRDLAANRRRCVLAYFHHPRFLAGDVHGEARGVAPIWEALYEAHADLVLSGHEHNFQQLAPLDPQGRPEPARGVRSFVVGTGGARLYQDEARPLAPGALEKRQIEDIGVLQLLLKPDGYSWRFVAIDPRGQARVTAVGSDVCR